MTTINDRRLRANAPRKHRILRYWELYLLFLPVFVWYIVFAYAPMYGIVIAFKKFSVIKGIMASPWVGLANFRQLFKMPMFWRALRNTLILAAQDLLIGFPMPIIFALLLNELRRVKFKKFVQTVSYLPHFISWSVAGGLVYMVLALDTGVINNVIHALGGVRKNFMGLSSYYRPIYLISSIWKTLGWSAIVYLAAVTGIDEELYEAAYIDGANRWNRIRYITLPGIRTTVAVLLILRVGSFLSVNFDQTYILINDSVNDVGETLDFYIYRVGLFNASNLSQATAVGLMKSLVGLFLIVTTNIVSSKLTDGEGVIW